MAPLARRAHLLNIIATIDKPTSGSVLLSGQELSKIDEEKLSSFRRNELGIVFQDFNLIDSLTVKENLALPMVLEKKPVSDIENRLSEVVRLLGIETLLEKRPYEISGGETQRVAIGRAIFNAPSLLLADEPTGNLDTKNSNAVMNLFSEINDRHGVTTLVVTHNPEAASYCKKIIFIRDGRLYNKIERGENRKQFFNQIMDVLSFLSTAQDVE
ncbi:MAG: ABC transporter ATP-binding protein [Bacteroidales bacterium]|nr:ABC transporter ATP-binding protein [Bacteroidales bacterium]